MAGQQWHEPGQPLRQPQDYLRQGPANLLVLFQPATGEGRAKGVRQWPNTVLPPWLKAELAAILTTFPPPAAGEAALKEELWQRWQVGRRCRIMLPGEFPPLRLLGAMDNLAGQRRPGLVLWRVARGSMPLSPLLSGSWLDRAESLQRLLTRRALGGQPPQPPEAIIAWREATARGWPQAPTVLVIG